MKKRSYLFAILATLFAFASTAQASTGHVSHVRPLRIVALRGQQSSNRCTQNIPPTESVAVWVTVNGRSAQSASTTGRTQYYAAAATLVTVKARPGNGPICASALTSLPRASVRVTFRVL